MVILSRLLAQPQGYARELKTKKGWHLSGHPFFWRRHPDLNRGIAVLQTAALPLGYAAQKMPNVSKDTV
jgi:hypothetical protein